MISAKLVKVSADILPKPLTIAINYTFSYGIFPDKSKIASVVPSENGKLNKIKFLIVDQLTCQIFLHVWKCEDQLLSRFKDCFSPLNSGYRKGYSTKEVIIYDIGMINLFNFGIKTVFHIIIKYD